MIYKPLVAEGYEWVIACDDRDFETFAEFDGSRRSSSWKPIKVLRAKADDDDPGRPSDFPWLGASTLVFRRRAVEELRDLLEASGEILPLATTDDVELFVLNAQLVNALDEQRASLIKFPGTNRIMHIQKVAFVDRKIQGLDLFRLPHRGSPTYVSERFVERVNAAGLVGLEFNRVWPPED